MSQITVHNQSELDAALAREDIKKIIINSPADVWLTLGSNGAGSSRVVARDSSHVVAWGLSRVVARESSRIEVTAPVNSIRPIDPTKCKSPTVHVLREVDIDGEPVQA
ncbi:hypothetical protein [Propionimicrobium sp. PCR01-08-3]|uniref:hypothetical protein n=1 Tax=Propionimicrobium sp. PCR01-08-3 TaxID=3052086 RepID=UPI00255C878F|nr:hypothetical protein [Propionimicrobium sp. PCR01-08-3]WIY84303.1 hypothetical protein QQ658_15190 [Propionimicrobium sp. PCR01-08-3]